MPFMVFSVTYTICEGPNLKWKNIYIMTFSIANWDTWDGSFALSMQVEDVIMHSNGKVSWIDILVYKMKVFLSIMLPNVILCTP